MEGWRGEGGRDERMEGWREGRMDGGGQYGCREGGRDGCRDGGTVRLNFFLQMGSPGCWSLTSFEKGLRLLKGVLIR